MDGTANSLMDGKVVKVVLFGMLVMANPKHCLTSWDDKPLVAFIVVLNFHLLDYILSIPVQDDGCPVASASTGPERLLHPLPNFLSCSPVGQWEHCHGSTKKGLYADS